MEKFIFSDVQIKEYSKFLDGLINFRKFLPKDIKVFLLFKVNLGKCLEKYDRTLWENILKFINQLYNDNKISDNIADLLKSIFKAWDDASQDELINILTKEIAGKVNILDNDTQEEAFIKSTLLMISTLKPDLVKSLHDSYKKISDSADNQ